MTGLGTRLGRTIGRVGVGLGVGVVAAMAAALLVTPLASATPDGDADAAISQAWDAGGGPTGPLGIKDGGVYAAGAGFGQNFAGGKIFFTPNTGAHAMRGAILDEYQSLGGPADGDLGFPTIDEGDGRAPGSRNTTFSAADRPVIFWTPDTGARVVRGAINAAWDQLGGSAGVLGVPTDDEAYRGEDVTQNFSGGQITWNRTTKTFTTTPPELADQLTGLDVPGDVTTAIAAARRAAGGPLGPLGATDGAQYAIGSDGAGQNYAGGKIFYSPATGATVLTGQVLAKYDSVGGPESDLGFPIGDEADGGLAPMSKVARFAAADRPVIFWTPDFGAVIVRGAMNAAWTKLGGATGQLGAPTADQTENDDVVTQKFNGGAISWNKTTNEFTTEPASLQSQLKGLDVPGGNVAQAKPAAGANPDGGTGGIHPTVWWLLGIVPILVLVAVATAAVLLNRRRRDHRGFEDDYDYDDDDYHEDGSGPNAAARPLDEDGGRRSGWAMPSDEHGDISPSTRDDEPDGFVANLSDDQDAIETAPTPVVTAEPETDAPWFSDLEDPAAPDHQPHVTDDDDDAVPASPSASESFASEPLPSDSSSSESEPRLAPAFEPEPDSGPPSGRHAAIHLDEPVAAETSLRLASADRPGGPDGYPIKADTKTGLFWTPGSAEYDDADAEIWFASEEFALTNGFVRG